MKSIKTFFSIYWPFAKINIQSRMNFSINFFMFILGGMMQVFTNYYLWKAIFSNSTTETLGGFTFNEMVIYIFISYVTSRFITSNADDFISEQIRDGSISMNLIKPIRYHVMALFDSIGGSIYNFVFVGLPIWIGLMLVNCIVYNQAPPSISTIISYLVSLILSFIILFLFNLSFGLLAFVVVNNFGLRSLKNVIINLFSGYIIPISFFPDFISNILNYFPFIYLNYIPAMIYMGKITGCEIIKNFVFQVLWIITLIVLDVIIWRKTVKYLCIQGG